MGDTQHRRTRSDSGVVYRSYAVLEVLHEEAVFGAPENPYSYARADAEAHARLMLSLRFPWRVARGAGLGMALVVALIGALFSTSVTGDRLWGPAATPHRWLSAQVVHASFSNSSLIVTASTEPPSQCPAGCFGAFPYPDGAGFSLEADVVRTVFFNISGPNGPVGVAEMAVPSDLVDMDWTTIVRTDADLSRRFCRAVIDSTPLPADAPPGSWASALCRVVAADNSTVGTVFVVVFYEIIVQGSSYCEAVRVYEPVAQPAGSYSSLAFLLTGVHMATVGVQDWRAPGAAPSQMASRPAASLVNGALHVFAAGASFAFHAYMTEASHNMDMLAVYMLVATPAVYCAACARGWPLSGGGRAMLAVAYATLVVAFDMFSLALQNSVGGSTVLVVALLAALVVSMCAWLRAPRGAGRPLRDVSFRWLAASALLIAVAYAARTADRKGGSACAPRAAFQLHAVWHVLSAGSLWCLWAFLRSEAPTKPPP